MELPEGTPIINFDPENPEDFEKKLRVALSDKSLIQNRDRPYAGQPHTNTGKKGQQELVGLTMRDVYDCILLGMVKAAPEESSQDHFGNDGHCSIEDCERPYCKYMRGELEHDDVYKLSFKGIDPVAIAQNACVSLWHRMNGTDEREL